MLDLLLDALLDTLKLIPFLFLTYLFMEYIEHKSNLKIENAIEKAGKFGPAVGGLLGVIPQCGFSSVAANFYAGHIITLGTLTAIFISTSDEMLPILIASAAPFSLIFRILSIKLVIAVLAGFVIDILFKKRISHTHEEDIHPLCERQGCNCGEGNIFLSALKHTLNISLFIFVISLICGLVIHFAGIDILSNTLFTVPILGNTVSGLMGLIPNCASSVLITNLYLDGFLPFGAMLSGLIVNSGVGLAVLFRMNRDLKENIKITALIFLIAVISGTLIDLLSFGF